MIAAARDGFDADAEMAALRLREGDVVFAVSGAGDHVLALLGASPKLVIACDPRPAQSHLLELKLAGLKTLSHGEYCELLGAKASRRRRGLYQRVRWLLSAEADVYWTAQAAAIEAGVLAQGRRERALAGFRRFVRLVQSAARVERFLAMADPREQAETLRREWDGFVWRRFAGRVLAGAIGSTDAEACRRSLEAAMTASPARENAELSWLLAGRFAGARPHLLREESFDALKMRANRVIVVCDRPERALAGLPDASVDAFALGDTLEDNEAFVRQAGRVGFAGSRLAGRTARVPAWAAAAEVVDRTPVPGVMWAATMGAQALAKSA